MMIIDMTPQFAVLADALDLLLIVSAGAILLEVYAARAAERTRVIRRLLRLEGGVKAPARA